MLHLNKWAFRKRPRSTYTKTSSLAWLGAFRIFYRGISHERSYNYVNILYPVCTSPTILFSFIKYTVYIVLSHTTSTRGRTPHHADSIAQLRTGSTCMCRCTLLYYTRIIIIRWDIYIYISHIPHNYNNSSII